jgi:hypothetical protein
LNENQDLKEATVSKQMYDLLSIKYLSMQQHVNKLLDENAELKKRRR